MQWVLKGIMTLIVAFLLLVVLSVYHEEFRERLDQPGRVLILAVLKYWLQD